MLFQELILTLQQYWHRQGCLLTQPYDVEKGAGTFNPNTFLRSLGPEPFSAAYPEPCRRPTDGRYGENPIRFQHYYQFQVVMKPSPANIVDLYLGSLREIGIDPEEHDIRFVHDDWESPTLGAWGLGWEVWADGMEVTQFTYFQQVGGFEVNPVMGEITYGLERLCMFLQGKESVLDCQYNEQFTYGELFHQNEVECSKHNFEIADIDLQLDLFNKYEAECNRLCEADIPLPAADYCLKASHAFNLLDARGAISVNERQGYILRVRTLARNVSEAYLANREALGFPLTKHVPPAAPPVIAEAVPPEGDTQPLLVELGVEEMPARVFGPLQKDLPQLFNKIFADSGLEAEDVKFFVTPRRITLSVGSMRTRQPDRTIEQKGPPLRIAKDGDGNWTKAATAFAQRSGLTPDDCEIRELKGMEYLFAVTRQEGRCALAELADRLPELFNKIHWYKTMRWGSGTDSFVRPVQWLVALLGDSIVPCAFAGVGAGRESRGHRFMADNTVAVSADRETYLNTLRDAYVLADQDERREKIRTALVAIAEENSLVWRQDAGLLEEVNNLVEYPFPLACNFDEKYLRIPDTVLVTEMKEHQRYLAFDKPAGGLANFFVALSNTQVKDEALSRVGYENVLVSRFSDAEFFLQEDQKIKLEDRLPKLEVAIFQAQLGSIREKVERIRQGAAAIAGDLGLAADVTANVDQIALLCKTDLTTAMVFEFPELQGEIGTYYARAEGLPEVVANGIWEHYQPKGAHDDPPSSVEAAVVGLADRFDSLAGIFGIGKAPTGSADPFALRRACLTAIHVIYAQGLDLDVEVALKRAAENVAAKLEDVDVDALTAKLVAFFRQRLTTLLQAEPKAGMPGGCAHDTVEAVLSADSPWTRLQNLRVRLEALSEFRKRPDFADVAATFKRCSNVLKSVDGSVDAAINPDLFEHDEEKELWNQIQATAGTIATAREAGDPLTALQAVVPVRTAVDAFFDAVFVNADDLAVRANRQALVAAVLQLVTPIADFAEIQG